MARQVINWEPKNDRMYGCSFLLKKGIQKLLEIEKEIVCEVARDDNHYLRKSADVDHTAQISSAVCKMNTLLICSLRYADFLS